MRFFLLVFHFFFILIPFHNFSCLIVVANSLTSNSFSSELQAAVLKRHDSAVESAHNAYSSSVDNDDDDNNRHDVASTESTECSLPFDVSKINFHSIAIPPKCLVSIPDFAECFSNPCIHTTDPSTPLFTKEECESIIQSSIDYFDETNGGKWTTLQSGRYPVCGFWIKDVPKVHLWFKLMLKQRLFPTLCSLFPDFVENVTDLVCDNAYLFRYTKETGQRTDVHTDSGCLSFTIALNSPSDYQGGGTWFDMDGGKVIHMQQGCVTFRPGGIRHRGESVTEGERYIIGGFVMHREKVEKVRMLTGLALEWLNQGKLKDAEEALRAAIFINPHFDAAYINLADILSKRNKLEDAIKVLEKVTSEVNPRNGEAAYTLGMMKKNTGDVEGAKKCFDICLDVDPLDGEAMMAHAILCSECKDNKGELSWFTRVTETPGVHKHTLASAYTNLGVISGEQGKTEEEINMYEKALTLDPSNVHARHSLALAYAGERKDYDQSIIEFRNAIQHAQNVEKRTKILVDLYRVTVMKVNQDPNVRDLAKDQIMNAFMECMGEANYRELMTIIGKQ
jgi:tetratricopeptide (TPR) repeat protein